ncbi:GHKL domain-containing protein [Paludicola sp. MB14-C6]|uniref:sensor histidine kinase n=1 Tax=Paludihabitans sp. MB14-C6 TaxID=3070656 RepID=UPI0027DBE1D4|nr:sensor histidine kinase [Paludicola sp. MB14-C6]WMJ21910.1 GHKL domain-containing protein [Paludicola sp. MB14-C6]
MFVIKKFFYKHMFILGMQGGYSLFIHSIVAIFLGFFGKSVPLYEQFLIQTTAFIILFVLITIPLWKYIQNSLIFRCSSTQEYYWNIIWLIPTLAVCGNAIVSMNEQWINTWSQVISRILMALALVISWRCVSLDFKSLEKIQILKDMNKILYMQKESIVNQAEIINENEKKIRIFKHDMRHHLQILLSLIEHKNNSEAIQLISQLSDTLQSTKPIVFCKNTVINSALLVYITKAQDDSIEVISEIDIPQIIPWNSNDIAILFANAIENAVIASAKQRKDKRKIEILTRYEDKKLAISIKNKFDGEIILGKTGFPVSNENDHGIGIQSMLSIINKYHAHASCSHNDGWFCVSFLFAEYFADNKDWSY